MEKELKVIYEELAEALEIWYGANKEKAKNLLCQYGHAFILKNPSLLGLNDQQSEELKKAYAIISFYKENSEVLDNA